jgi:hypothetical protein
MQKWEYGYMYLGFGSKPSPSIYANSIAVSDAAGSRLFDGPPRKESRESKRSQSLPHTLCAGPAMGRPDLPR